jgi:hypothetical protein
VEYVMVPVPEELAAKVLGYVSWKDTQANAERRGGGGPTAEGPDQGEAIARAYARLDDPSRALLAVAATAALEEDELSIPRAARRAGVTTREALGILMEVNNVLVAEGGPPIGFAVKAEEGRAADEFTRDAHIVMMPEALARPVADLARSNAPT